MAVASYARAAYALGWAAIDDLDTLPIGAAGHAGSLAAVRLAETVDHPDLIALIVEAGKTDAARQALHRARLRLYRQHRKLIVAAAAGLTKAVDHRLLTRNLLLASDQPRKVRQTQAIRTLTDALAGAAGIATAWQQANQTAWQAAAARGRSEAENSPPDGGPADPKKVTAGLATAAAAVGTVGGSGWIGGQISRQAWDLSGLDLPARDNPEQTVADSLAQMDGVAAAAEDQMHQALTGAFVDWFTQGPGTSLGQLAWVTEEDDRVCPECDANEANGPYDPADVPACPAHPLCRCSIELA